MSGTPPSPRYRALSQLKVWQPYTLVRLEEKRDGYLMLYLRGNKEEGEFISLFLLPHSARYPLRWAIEYNKKRNGDDAKLILQYTGVAHYGFPLMEVSGKGFTERLG